MVRQPHSLLDLLALDRQRSIASSARASGGSALAFLPSDTDSLSKSHLGFRSRHIESSASCAPFDLLQSMGQMNLRLRIAIKPFLSQCITRPLTGPRGSSAT